MGIVPVKSVSEIVKEVSFDKSNKDVGSVPSCITGDNEGSQRGG